MLLIEIWREEILPRVLKLGDPVSSFQVSAMLEVICINICYNLNDFSPVQSYMILFNEANLLNILETTLFHSSACHSLSDAAVDVTDYCVRQMMQVLSSETNLQVRSQTRPNILQFLKIHRFLCSSKKSIRGV